MTNRKKVKPEPILQNYGEVDNTLREAAQLDDEVAAIAKKQQEEIDKIKQKFEQKAEPLIARKIRLEKDIEEFCEYHRADFEKKRSKKLTFGVIGFRGSKELKTLKGWTWKKVCGAIEKLGFDNYLKITKSVKRADLRTDALAGKLNEKQLKAFGIFLNEKDEFYWEPDREALANAKGKLEVVRRAG